MRPIALSAKSLIVLATCSAMCHLFSTRFRCIPGHQNTVLAAEPAVAGHLIGPAAAGHAAAEIAAAEIAAAEIAAAEIAAAEIAAAGPVGNGDTAEIAVEPVGKWWRKLQQWQLLTRKGTAHQPCQFQVSTPAVAAVAAEWHTRVVPSRADPSFQYFLHLAWEWQETVGQVEELGSMRVVHPKSRGISRVP